MLISFCSIQRAFYYDYIFFYFVFFFAVLPQSLINWLILLQNTSIISFSFHSKIHFISHKLIALMQASVASVVLIYHHHIIRHMNAQQDARALHTHRVCKFMQLIYYGLHIVSIKMKKNIMQQQQQQQQKIIILQCEQNFIIYLQFLNKQLSCVLRACLAVVFWSWENGT